MCIHMTDLFIEKRVAAYKVQTYRHLVAFKILQIKVSDST